MADDDHDQATKQPSNPSQQRIPFTRRCQAEEADLVLTMALQEQERSSASASASAFTTTLETIESETDIDQDNETNTNLASTTSEESSYDYDHEDYEFFFEASGFEAELRFLDNGEDEDEDEDEDMEEYDDDDELDVDELTYEELIALGEFIGVEERGLSPNEISLCLNPIVSKSLNINNEINKSTSNSGIDRCVICQVEYEDGESLVALPCEHPFHSECISKWLQIKKCCPICSYEVSSSSSSNSPNKNNNVNNSC